MVKIISNVISQIRNFLLDEKFKEISSGSFLTLIARVGTVLLGLLFNLLVARFYGPQILGILAILQAFLGLAVVFATMGTNTLVLRMVPEHFSKYSSYSAYRVYIKILQLCLFLGLAVAAVILFSAEPLASNIYQKDYLKIFIIGAGFVIIFHSIGQVSTESLRALKKVKLYAWMIILGNILNVTFLSIFILLDQLKFAPIYVIFSTFVLVSLISLTLSLFIFKKQVFIKKKYKDVPYKSLIRNAFPMFLTASMHILISQTDIFMLGALNTEEEVGIYSITVKLAFLTSFVLLAINAVSAPKFSELFYSNKLDELAYIAKKSSKFIFWATIPILSILLLFGKFILTIFGSEFSKGYLALAFLVIGQFINSSMGSVGHYLSMTGHQIAYRNIVLVATFINIMLNFLLIPSWGMFGAAFASMISIGFWNITAAVYIKKIFGFSISYIPFITKN